MQVPILSGITSGANADFRTSYPVNCIPVPKDTGISKGYLRIAPGLTQLGTGPGPDRGGIVVDGVCLRVMGSDLVSVSADRTVTNIGSVGAGAPVSMDYSFDQLCIVSAGAAFLYGTSLQQITDVDVGVPIDVLWVDGYFLFTDGTYLYVTELNNPLSIDPLKYAASEIDPDRVVGLLKYRNEVYACNRNTIEVFDNIGGSGFPFTRLPGGLIPKGVVGTKAKTLFAESFAWVGSGRNEPCSVYMASGATALKIATREVEERLAQYSEDELATVIVEAKADRMHQHLYVHLPNETMVYDYASSIAVGEPVWFFMSTGAAGIQQYRARHFIYCYGRWLAGDTEDGRIGYVDENVASQYGEVAGWQFDTMILYNAGKGAQVHCLELVGTTGRAPEGDDPVVFTSYTLDGRSWSEEKQARIGVTGNTQQRVVWRRQGKMRNFRGQRFRGANKTPVSWARLEAELEPLNA